MTIQEIIARLENMQQTCESNTHIPYEQDEWRMQMIACVSVLEILEAAQQAGAATDEEVILMLRACPTGENDTKDIQELVKLLMHAEQVMQDFDKKCDAWRGCAFALYEMLRLPGVLTAVGTACITHPVKSIPVVCSAFRQLWRMSAVLKKVNG